MLTDEGEAKIDKKARLEQLEPMEIVQFYTLSYHKAMESLNCLSPSIEPRATGHIIEQIEMVKKILVEGGELNSKDKLGRTPLHWAAEKGYLKIAKYLIQKGAAINVTDNEGETPLHDAVQCGKKQIVELLISKKANINIKGVDGSAPLHKAIANGNIDIVNLLKSHGALL